MHAPNAFLFNFCTNITFDKTFDLWQLHEIKSSWKK